WHILFVAGGRGGQGVSHESGRQGDGDQSRRRLGDSGSEQSRRRRVCDAGDCGQQAVRADARDVVFLRGEGMTGALAGLRVIDMRGKNPGDLISVEDLELALRRIDYTLKPGDIVLIHTGADKRWGSREYFLQPGLGRESTLWLVEQGVRVIGIDAWTLDRPFANMIADFKNTGDGRLIWPSHFAGITKEYCQIEKLANLETIPRPHGFYVSCLPVKIKGASAG